MVYRAFRGLNAGAKRARQTVIDAPEDGKGLAEEVALGRIKEESAAHECH